MALLYYFNLLLKIVNKSGMELKCQTTLSNHAGDHELQVLFRFCVYVCVLLWLKQMDGTKY